MTALNTENDILAILTTSSGKSMLALIPALLEQNLLTVLILPLKSLITDYKRKLEQMDLPFLHYTGRTIPRGFCTPNLVLVSVDMAREQHWKQWIAEVDTVKHVRRFCFDEGHYPLTDAKFRKSVRDIFTIRSLPCQLLVFSGTISPKCEPMIKEMFLMHDNVKVFRSPSTNRPEFQLIKTAPQLKFDIPDIIHQLWTLHFAKFTPQERALVFVPFIDLGQNIAAKLGCQFYNSQDMDKDKEIAYHAWRNGTYQIMVSTSAFSCGNDYPHIPLIIHAGTPREMIGYIQEISRGGRDKKQTFCYLLPIAQWTSASSTELDDLLGVKEMADMCFGPNKYCLRHKITQYNDGHGIHCQEDPNNYPCNHCLPTAGLLPSLGVSKVNPFKRKAPSDLYPVKAQKSIKLDEPIARPVEVLSPEMQKTWDKIQKATQAIHQNEVDIRDDLATKLNLLLGDCAMCHCTGQFIGEIYQENRHEFKHCRFHQQHSAGEYMRLKNLITYNSKIHEKICFICHVPSFGDKLHTPFNGPGNCQYLDIILPTVYSGYTHRKRALEEHFGTQWTTIEQFAFWLNGKLAKPKEKSNLISVFIRIGNTSL